MEAINELNQLKTQFSALEQPQFKITPEISKQINDAIEAEAMQLSDTKNELTCVIVPACFVKHKGAIFYDGAGTKTFSGERTTSPRT